MFLPIRYSRTRPRRVAPRHDPDAAPLTMQPTVPMEEARVQEDSAVRLGDESVSTCDATGKGSSRANGAGKGGDSAADRGGKGPNGAGNGGKGGKGKGKGSDAGSGRGKGSGKGSGKGCGKGGGKGGGKGNGKGRGSWSAAPFRLVMKEAWKRGKGKGAGGQRRTLGLALTGEVSEGASLRKAVDDAFKGACARAASCSHCPHTPPCASLCATPCAMCHAMLCSPPHPHIVCILCESPEWHGSNAAWGTARAHDARSY